MQNQVRPCDALIAQQAAEQAARNAAALECKARIAEEMKTCPTCIKYAGQMAPSHEGSKRCQSGSIASGGHRSHCSCDTCF